MPKEIKDIEAYKARQKALKAEASKDIGTVLEEKVSTGKYEYSRAYNKLYQRVRKGTSHINKQVAAGVLEDKKAGLIELAKFLEKELETVQHLI